MMWHNLSFNYHSPIITILHTSRMLQYERYQPTSYEYSERVCQSISDQSQHVVTIAVVFLQVSIGE